MESVGNYLVKPAIVGGIAALGASQMYPGMSLTTAAGDVSVTKATFAAVAIGSIFSDLVHSL